MTLACAGDGGGGPGGGREECGKRVWRREDSKGGMRVGVRR